MHIHHPGAADHAAIEDLLDSAFGADRKTRTAYRLRAGMAPIRDLTFVAHNDDGGLIGSIQCWPIELRSAEGVTPLILLGPVAVAPDLQRSGVGKQLMHKSLAVADATGAPPMLLIGDVEYYGKFGFNADATAGWAVPGPVDRHRLLARLKPGASLPKKGELGPATTAARQAA